MSETLTLLSGGSEGEPRTILRSMKSWSESMSRETKVFQLSHDERYVAMGNARHSLWAYAKFRASGIAEKHRWVADIASRGIFINLKKDAEWFAWADAMIAHRTNASD